ncbi:hypothetical protein E2C01_041560 [Portunus trituberculatus]|uniref:Uncharacterized protein n=1 Tax=Portunus trituberculatus TaxID=210409 RepID=A0A5B7FS09_PORTR|nr:hypothetical protein [Portunus trituberculatus]
MQLMTKNLETVGIEGCGAGPGAKWILYEAVVMGQGLVIPPPWMARGSPAGLLQYQVTVEGLLGKDPLNWLTLCRAVAERQAAGRVTPPPSHLPPPALVLADTLTTHTAKYQGFYIID